MLTHDFGHGVDFERALQFKRVRKGSFSFRTRCPCELEMLSYLEECNRYEQLEGSLVFESRALFTSGSTGVIQWTLREQIVLVVTFAGRRGEVFNEIRSLLKMQRKANLSSSCWSSTLISKNLSRERRRDSAQLDSFVTFKLPPLHFQPFQPPDKPVL